MSSNNAKPVIKDISVLDVVSEKTKLKSTDDEEVYRNIQTLTSEHNTIIKIVDTTYHPANMSQDQTVNSKFISQNDGISGLDLEIKESTK